MPANAPPRDGTHLQAFFLPVAGVRPGYRFCLFHPPQGAVRRGAVLYVHPFAEEMNKARRMAALQARALSHAGYAVLQMDLLGCGDSSGDFGDASWSGWIDDVARGCDWLAAHGSTADGVEGGRRLWLWGLRAGCLLAVEAARQLGNPCHLLLWHPPPTGKMLLHQFLRLRSAGDMLDGKANDTIGTIQRQLKQGSPVEIAGYKLSPALANGLQEANLMPPRPTTDGQRLEWFEVSARESASPGPVSATTLDLWRQSGFTVASHVVRGPAFWQTREIEECPALIMATTSALTS